MLADFVLYGVLIGYLGGGRLSHIQQVESPNFWLIVGGFVLRFAIVIVPLGGATWISLIGMGLVLAGTLWGLRTPGMTAICVGAGCNLLVMLANGGRMPVSIAMAQRLNLDTLIERLGEGQFHDYTVLTGETTLPFLADILPYFSLLFFQPYVISIGDYILGIGVVWFLVKAMKGRETRTIVMLR